MNFEPQQDLALFLDGLERIAAHHRGPWRFVGKRFDHDLALESTLREAGFLGCAREESLGPVAAAAMVYELARLPQCAEVAASALLGPLLWPQEESAPDGALAVLWGDVSRPARYLPGARTVLHLESSRARWARPEAGTVTLPDSAFAYPMGRLAAPPQLHWTELPSDVAEQALARWRVGVAAELLGCLQAGLDAVVGHVSERRQFGRPLGAFQAVQHRLASAASAVQAGRWLMLRAADDLNEPASPANGLIALGHAQDIATRICHDLHQFMGAMGLTLEHPLHRWTYRARLLRSELGGATLQFQALARGLWAEPIDAAEFTH